MPKTINPIRKRIVKRELKKGKSIREALTIGGYGKGTARGKNNGTTNKVVKVCQEEILQEFDKSKITIDYIIKDLEKAKQTAISKGDIGNWIKVDELFGKYKQIWNDKGIQVNVSQSQGTEQKELKERTNKHRGIVVDSSIDTVHKPL